MKETEYIGKLKERFHQKNPKGFFYKIPDSNDGQQRPYDGYFVLKSKGVTFFEAKITKSLSPWHFNKIEPHQILNLRLMLELGCRAYVVLGIRALTKKFDRKRLPRELSHIYADIWIPVGLIPGTGDSIEVKKLNIRELVASLGDDLKGHKVNEIYLHQRRFEGFTESAE